MKKTILFPATIIIMILSLGFMSINRLIFPMPDWAVRCIGVLMMADIVTIIYLTIRSNRKLR